MSPIRRPPCRGTSTALRLVATPQPWVRVGALRSRPDPSATARLYAGMAEDSAPDSMSKPVESRRRRSSRPSR